MGDRLGEHAIFAPACLTGKRALVTGASGGLGAHFARRLAAAGATVVIAARRTEPMEALVQEIERGGGTAIPIRLDVTSPASIAEAIGAAVEIDILVNNAGISRGAPALELQEPDWDAVMDTNLKGMFLVAQAVARGMRDRHGGSIINIASILGLRQSRGVLPYAVSKAGVIQITKVMALEFARYGIRVNALAPGYLATDLSRAYLETDPGKAMVARIPMRRLGDPGELDGPLLLLASDVSSYMTGSVITVDGGHLVSSL